MKKQKGFTMIELMVVMAIIAILAIAGLATYVNNIKKARDTARITDLATISKAVMAVVTDTGKSPKDIDDVVAAIKEVNSGVLIKDPTGTSTCLSAGGSSSGEVCSYYYRQCDNGGGYVVSTRLESTGNLEKYTTDGIETITGFEGSNASNADSFWSLGACKSLTCTSTDCGITAHTVIAPEA